MTTLLGSFECRVQFTQIVNPIDTRVLALSLELSIVMVRERYSFYFLGPAPERLIVRTIEAGRTVQSGRSLPASRGAGQRLGVEWIPGVQLDPPLPTLSPRAGSGS